MRPTQTFTSELLGPQGASLFSWRPSGDLLAAASSRKKKVVVFDAAGEVAASLTVPDPEYQYDETQESPVVALSWHPSGSHLAILPRGQPFAMVWSASGGLARLDSGVKPAEVTALTWNPDSLQLALGTVKGTAIMHDVSTRAATPLQLNRSTKAISCIAWSPVAAPAGLLALGCKGGALLLVRAADGCVVRSIQMKAAVSQLQFCDPEAAADGQVRPATATATACSLLAANLGGRAVGIWQLPQALAADSGGFELAFRDAYGDLQHYAWLSRRLLVAGFSSGQLVAVALSTGTQPGVGIGTELFSSRSLHQAVSSLSWCAATGALAAAGGGQVALLQCVVGGGLEAPTVQQDGGVMELEANQRLASIQLSACGRLITLGTASGRLLQLRATPPLLHGTCGNRLAYINRAASLSQALLLDAAGLQPGRQRHSQGATAVALQLPVDPEHLSLGPTHLAAAHGSKVWLQALQPDPSTGLLPAPTEVEFPAPIHWLCVSSACLLLLCEGGRVFVQLGPTGGGGEVVELRGDDGNVFSAACAALTEHCVVVGLPSGTLASYRCSDAALISEFHHTGSGITCVHPSPDGSLLLFQDGDGGVFLHHTTKGHLMPLPDYHGELSAAVWDCRDHELLLAVNDSGTAYVFRHIPQSVQGPGVKLVGTQPAVKGAVPLLLVSGTATWHLLNGSLDTQLLATHQHLAAPTADAAVALSRSSSFKPRPSTASGWGSIGAAAGGEGHPGIATTRKEQLAAQCQQALALCHFETALTAAKALGNPQTLKELALAALQFLELRVAVAAYDEMAAAGDEEAQASLAQLQPLLEEQDEAIVTGHIIAFVGGDLDRAEELLLDSSRPAAAIQMRSQLGHWERALELAEALEPHAVGSLALLRAQALESDGQAEAALATYQQALEAPDLVTGGSAAAVQRHTECRGGIARCTILLGDVERGVELAAGGGNEQLLLQCAALLETAQQPREAGQLYSQAGLHERAARLFLSCREFALLDGVMTQHGGSPELWFKYAAVKEDLGSYRDAVRAYEQAGDVPGAVRVLLERLEDPEAAAELARQAGSTDSRLAVARFCERSGQLELAMQQYCLAGNCPAAFLVAQRNACMAAFANLARQQRSVEAAELASTHYELDRQLAVAGELAVLAGKHVHAARLFLQAGGDSIAAAIKLVGEVQDPAVSALVLEQLQAVDGAGPHLLDLHLVLGNVEQACAVAVACAEREQANGNYKVARDQLLRVCLELQQRGATASPPLLASLHLLHCYLLVRQLVRQGDHSGAARLLLVVAERIQAFPKHIVPILTSTVIECHRAALHGPAQRWAAVLLEQYPDQVAATYSKKIEAIAKQPAWTTEQEAPEPTGDCLLCGAAGPETSLQCTACQRALPFCAASGKRMLLGDWSECQSCHFPCRGRDMSHLASVEGVCPLCESAVEVNDVRRIFDPFAHCRRTVFAGLLSGSPKN